MGQHILKDIAKYHSNRDILLHLLGIFRNPDLIVLQIPWFGVSVLGFAISALIPQDIIVSPCLTIAEPSAVVIEFGEIDTGRKEVKLDLPSGLIPCE